MLDIFNSQAFSLVRLTMAMNEIKYAPSRLQELGLFEADSTDVLTVAIEKIGDVLVIVPPSQRGGPGNTTDMPKRSLRNLTIPHFQLEGAMMADEIQGVRAFGSETALETIAGRLAKKLQIHVNSFAATEEHQRMGAIKGTVSYADGTSLNLFTEFGETQPTEIAFDLLAASPVAGVLRKTCAGIIRQIANLLDGVPFTGVRAFCGDNFFDALLQHSEIRSTFLNWNEAQILRDGYVGPDKSGIYGSFMFGGIIWENYRGATIKAADKNNNGTAQTFIDTDKCHFVPMGVPGLFKTTYAPADYMETVNTMGQRLYAKQWQREDGKGITFESQMNALQYCTRPRLLIGGRKGT